MVLYGVEGMLVGVALSGFVSVLLLAVLLRRLPPFTAWSWALFLFSVLSVGALTLTPAHDVSDLGGVGRPTSCSMDYGGPSPDGFWIMGGGQRFLNSLVFFPAGFFLVLALSRWRAAWALAPLGLAGLAGYSVAIEFSQLHFTYIRRACDVTDMVDNSIGAAVGFAVALLLVPLFRPWRHGEQEAQPLESSSELNYHGVHER